MRKTLYLLNVGEYAPEITALTYPLLEGYAAKIGAEVYKITTRCFPHWDLDYEKLQIYRLAKERQDDWSLYIDSDAIVHPELPDLTELIPRDTVAHNGVDFAPIRWRYDEYFRRDGRHIGSCNWLAIASSWCRDLWRPLDDLTPEEAVANISLTVKEEQSGVVTAAHLVSDYALSRNIARFGLKCVTLNGLWKQHGLEDSNFFYHEYTSPRAERVVNLRKVLKSWNLHE